ncbi:3-hydroxyacyl-CoA dehydrogenase NAD-binding domain-containing protein [Wukongibacter baidiensis]|uniref:3-hydroxyacyl-CoA dehydrogenase NAD-binding domain-containing protein n=1 Tax=Wukongibacter baidiensis TaxID=1723361 RepID=UPI003D7FA126
MEIKKVLIVGSGQMGSGIAHVMAQKGIKISMRDASMEIAEKGLASIEKNLNRQLSKGRITEELKELTLSNINIGGEFTKEDCDVDLAIEAVTENMELKVKIFKKLDEWCPEDTILATNTSSLPVTALGSITKRPEKMVGMHFFSPVFIMRLVEVVKSLATSEETVATIMELGRFIGKDPVEVTDYPGFVGNRIMVPMMNEAITTLYEGVADAETIDAVAKLGFNHPIGPLRLCDAIGNDTILAVMEVLYEGFGDPKYRPCPLLRKMVEAGWLGKKSGRGFYNDYKKK